MKQTVNIAAKRISCMLTATALLLTTAAAYSQDIHFSQFFNSPYNLNPGLTGQFTGAYRFICNQRTQWRSVTVPYATIGFGADAHHIQLPDGLLNTKDGEPYKTDFNAGISFFHDKAGDSQLTSNQINLMIGKDFPVGKMNNEIISGAVAIGFTGMNIDYSSLRYDNQWNGFIYDPGLSPGERFSRSSRGYLNLNAGVAYRKTKSIREELIAGISVFNISNPRQSFFDDGYVKLDTRWNIHGSYKFPLRDEWLIEPMLMSSIQGTYNETNIGAIGYYVSDPRAFAWKALYAGVYGRARDAGYIVAGMQYNEWNAALSYDINLSSLRPASNGRGGFEFSLIYIIPPAPAPRKIKVCPDYM